MHPWGGRALPILLMVHFRVEKRRGMGKRQIRCTSQPHSKSWRTPRGHGAITHHKHDPWLENLKIPSLDACSESGLVADSPFFMLTISGISKAYGPKELLSEASLQVNKGDRIGLVGPNGAGKSTLLKMVLSQVEPDSGTIQFQRGSVLGYLPQEMADVDDETVLELAVGITEEHKALRRVVIAESVKPETLGHSIEDCHQRFQDLDGYRLEAMAAKVLVGLGFKNSDFTRPARDLSGGWIMRAHLARLLVQEPDLLMLDEPTNHLDLPSLRWLQAHLERYVGAIFLISHDREFLNRVVDSIVDVERSTLKRYRGNYDEFLDAKEAEDDQAMAAYQNQQKEIDRLMLFVNRFRAKNTKAKQAQSKLKQVERMDKLKAPKSEDRSIQFSFPQPKRSGQRVINLKDVAHAYGKLEVYRGLEFEVERGQCIGLVGPNGAGKTTLLKLLAGVESLQTGERNLGPNVDLGYFSQHRVETLDENSTVMEEALRTSKPVTETYARSVLGCFMFRGDDVFKQVKVLSGGEKSRLALVKLLLCPPNLLLMDEPTTHLDIDSVEALVFALKQFEGTLVFVSHDVHFLRSLAERVVHVEDGELRHYHGDYDYYVEKSAADLEQPKLDQTPSKVSSGPAAAPSVSSKERRRQEAQERQKRSKVLKAKQSKVERFEKQIIEIENRLAEIGEKLADSAIYRDPAAAKTLRQEESRKKAELVHVSQDWELAVEEYTQATEA
jgi:ATP-binding cassette, subfamily F, member 3